MRISDWSSDVCSSDLSGHARASRRVDRRADRPRLRGRACLRCRRSAEGAVTVLTPEEIARLPYRPCVGLLLLNRDGTVLVGRRIDTAKAGDTIWQLPQGGIDTGETTEEWDRRGRHRGIGDEDRKTGGRGK